MKKQTLKQRWKKACTTDNRQYHNFFNGSEIERVHLVATVLQSNLDDMHLHEEVTHD